MVVGLEGGGDGDSNFRSVIHLRGFTGALSLSMSSKLIKPHPAPSQSPPWQQEKTATNVSGWAETCGPFTED